MFRVANETGETFKIPLDVKIELGIALVIVFFACVKTFVNPKTLGDINVRASYVSK